MDIETIVYPCNTGHIHRKRLQNETGIYMFDMIEPTKQMVIEQSKSKKIGLLASTATIKTKLYEHAECELITPSHDLQELIQSSIIKMGAMPNIHLDTQYLKDLDGLYNQSMNEMVDKGADTLVIGCTDISMLHDVAPMIFDPHKDI